MSLWIRLCNHTYIHTYKSSYHDQHHLSRASRLGCVYMKLGQSKLFARVCASVQFICGASTWGPNY